MPIGRGKAIVAGEPMRLKKSQANKKQVQMPLQDRLLFLTAQGVLNRGCPSLLRALFFISITAELCRVRPNVLA
jgi:hypothetical protein